MKTLKKLASLALAATLLVSVAGATSMEVSANAPQTFCVRYDIDEGEWRMQVGSTWDELAEHREMYYLEQEIKDGDYLVVYNEEVESTPLHVPAYLGNLTVCKSPATIVVHTEGINECFLLADTVSSINGNINKAYVYGNAKATFNSPVDCIEIYNDVDIIGTVCSHSTVNRVVAKNDGGIIYDIYNVVAGRLDIENGSIRMSEEYYSKTPAPAAAPVQQPAAAPTAPQQPAGGNDYDDVPKTGEGNMMVWLMGIASLCFLGIFGLKKAN